MQLLKLIAVTQRRPVLMRSQWPRTVPRWAPSGWLLLPKQSRECAMWTEFWVWRQIYSGRAWFGCGLDQCCSHLYRAHAHKPRKRDGFPWYSHSCLLTWRASAKPHSFSNFRACGLMGHPLSSWVGCSSSEVERQEWQQKQERRSTVSCQNPGCLLRLE